MRNKLYSFFYSLILTLNGYYSIFQVANPQDILIFSKSSNRIKKECNLIIHMSKYGQFYKYATLDSHLSNCVFFFLLTFLSYQAHPRSICFPLFQSALFILLFLLYQTHPLSIRYYYEQSFPKVIFSPPAFRFSKLFLFFQFFICLMLAYGSIIELEFTLSLFMICSQN